MTKDKLLALVLNARLFLVSLRRMRNIQPENSIRIPVSENVDKIPRKLNTRGSESLCAEMGWLSSCRYFNEYKRTTHIAKKALSSEASLKRPKGLGIERTESGIWYSVLA